MENINKTKSIKNKITEMTIVLCDVLLFSSAVNCLFQLLAHGKAFDITFFIISLGLALLVYFKAIDGKKNPIVKKRLIIAISCVLVWAILLPLLALTFKI